MDKIGDTLFSVAVNAFTGEAGTGVDPETGRKAPLAAIARGLKARGQRWVAVGDENYGEGGSREHAAMSPRHLGAAAILARSFPRLPESDLKKHGLVALALLNPAVSVPLRARVRRSLPHF